MGSKQWRRLNPSCFHLVSSQADELALSSPQAQLISPAPGWRIIHRQTRSGHYLQSQLLIVFPEPGQAGLEAEVDSLKLVDSSVPALGHPPHLGLVHLGENDDCDVGRESGRMTG